MDKEKDIPFDYLEDDKAKPIFRAESWWLILALGSFFILQYIELNRLQKEHHQASTVVESLNERYEQALENKRRLGELALKVWEFAPEEPFAEAVVNEFLINPITESPSP